ncbi:MAG: hypothetical protein WCK60_01920 [Candidatus Nomurabacteria bacterium]
MVSKISLQNNEEIRVSFNKNSFLRFMNAMGMISKEAQKSAGISWRQYKSGKARVINDANDLLA